VKGNLIQFNDNGAWCWYQDERAIIDVSNGKLILGSDASPSGAGGNLRNGNVESVIYDVNTGSLQRYTLRKGDPNVFYCDDHNAPAFLIRPDGKYLTIYAAHFYDTSSYYRVFDAGAWGDEKSFNWKKQRPGGANFQTTYSNIFYLSSENRVYNFVRGNNKSPNFMYSTDQGDTWTYGGQLTTNANIGYNNGYYKYCSNGIDRIDFICSDYHPRDFNTSIFHGYIYKGRTYRSDGAQVDNSVFDTLNLPTTDKLTVVFAANTVINGDTMRRCWNTDVYRYDDGTIATIVTARINNNVGGSSGNINPNHCFIYCRFNGSSWKYTYLGQAGLKLYMSEQDYTGLATVHPNDPNTIYISSTYDPRDNKSLGVHEIFKGVTSDQGATWTWTQITQKSVRDNVRPIIPVWDKNNTALLWWRGTYSSAQTFDAAVVGIIDHRLENVSSMKYVDATLSNTSLATGSPLTTTGPDSNAGVTDGKWHIRTGIGNGGTVFTSSEVGGEDAPPIKTQVTIPNAGTYDVWVNYWANPAADWRIKAGLSLNGMRLFRQMACKQVEPGDHDVSIVLNSTGNTFLYQAYLGRVQLGSNSSFDVYVDDSAVSVGSQTALRGDIVRTMYDGISYALVNRIVNVSENKKLPSDYTLSQNFPNPFNPTTIISYMIPKSDFVILKIYDLLGREVKTLINEYQGADKYSINFDGTGFTSGMYYYRLKVGNNFADTKKMLLLR
jgi:hypothetical protein